MASLLGMTLYNDQDETAAQQGALSGAMSGAAVGSKFGVEAAVAGAVIGGGLGMIQGAKASKKQRQAADQAAQAAEAARIRMRINEAGRAEQATNTMAAGLARNTNKNTNNVGVIGSGLSNKAAPMSSAGTF